MPLGPVRLRSAPDAHPGSSSTSECRRGPRLRARYLSHRRPRGAWCCRRCGSSSSRHRKPGSGQRAQGARAPSRCRSDGRRHREGGLRLWGRCAGRRTRRSASGRDRVGGGTLPSGLDGLSRRWQGCGRQCRPVPRHVPGLFPHRPGSRRRDGVQPADGSSGRSLRPWCRVRPGSPAAWCWWIKRWPNLWGPKPSALLPLAAATTSLIIAQRFLAAGPPPAPTVESDECPAEAAGVVR